MGAYQHSPLREFLLGGVTRHMLAHADLPVLLRHYCSVQRRSEPAFEIDEYRCSETHHLSRSADQTSSVPARAAS